MHFVKYRLNRITPLHQAYEWVEAFVAVADGWQTSFYCYLIAQSKVNHRSMDRLKKSLNLSCISLMQKVIVVNPRGNYISSSNLQILLYHFFQIVLKGVDSRNINGGKYRIFMCNFLDPLLIDWRSFRIKANQPTKILVGLVADRRQSIVFKKFKPVGEPILGKHSFPSLGPIPFVLDIKTGDQKVHDIHEREVCYEKKVEVRTSVRYSNEDNQFWPFKSRFHRLSSAI